MMPSFDVFTLTLPDIRFCQRRHARLISARLLLQRCAPVCYQRYTMPVADTLYTRHVMALIFFAADIRRAELAIY